MSDQKLIIHGNPYIIYFLHDFLPLNHSEIDENAHRLIAAPLLLTVGQSIVVLWHQSTHTSIVMSFWLIVLGTLLSGTRASSRHH